MKTWQTLTWCRPWASWCCPMSHTVNEVRGSEESHAGQQNTGGPAGRPRGWFPGPEVPGANMARTLTWTCLPTLRGSETESESRAHTVTVSAGSSITQLTPLVPDQLSPLRGALAAHGLPSQQHTVCTPPPLHGAFTDVYDQAAPKVDYKERSDWVSPGPPTATWLNCTLVLDAEFQCCTHNCTRCTCALQL